jgi:trehalose/maltose hydrolase-like predicted phosphorylase
MTSYALTIPTPATALAGPSAHMTALQHSFRAIIFDWDGTAVVDRKEDATALAGLLEELLRLGVWAAVVTGTNFGNIDRQLCGHIAPARRRRLLICANRGSEVYGFDRRGISSRRYLRVATSAEEQALTATADAVRDQLIARTGLDIRVIYDRLNRRKIDLIPLPEWADPPKARIGELLAAVERRLRGAGLPGGLGEAVALAEHLAREHGLPDARCTTDVKHIEIGLTDKSDAMAWLTHELLKPQRIGWRDVLIGGDEFGPIAGFPGSDDLLRVNDEAVVVSVGPEPNGVPAGVIHLGGGPLRFRTLLAEQVWRQSPHRQDRHPPSASRSDDIAGDRSSCGAAWCMEDAGEADQPLVERDRESRFTVSNGFLGVRGSREQPTVASLPRTYLAGVFDTPPGEHAIPVLVSGPDWLRLRATMDGVPLPLDATQAAYARTLDYARGTLVTKWSQEDADGRTMRMRALRFVSLAERGLAVQIVRIEVAQPVWLALDAWLEPPDDRLVSIRAASVGAEPESSIWRTADGTGHLAVASGAALQRAGEALRDDPCREPFRHRWGWVAMPDRPVTFARVVATARDTAAEVATDPGDTARAALRRARRRGPVRLLAAHARAWADRWTESDIEVVGDDRAQAALRFAVYHLVSAANPDDPCVSIGARALTGDSYLGHVFWDTEIFLLPFYIFTWPAAARALLMYRYHTLPAARAKATRLGYRGALYAWESARTGDEATPPFVIGPDGRVIPIRCGTDEQHISADIAYAVWQYWQATDDTAFLREAGAEIVLETARFWSSRSALEADGRYHIRGVIGPDEYHEGVDDNAFTNGMAIWNLERGLEVAALLRERWPERWTDLRAQLALTPDELARWRDVADRLATGVDAASGLIEQFAGFFGLESVDLRAFLPWAAPPDVVLGTERTQRSQVVKQADVVMLLALLWERFPPAVREANFRYYEPRTGHGSSLSPAIHALVAARLGDLPLAERFFAQAAAIDLDDTIGNAAGGVHIGTLGGLWQAAVLGFAGLRSGSDGLRFDPHLPDRWDALCFPVQWRGRHVRIEFRRTAVTLTASMTLVRGASLTVHLGTQTHRLTRGRPWTCRREDKDPQWQEESR